MLRQLSLYIGVDVTMAVWLNVLSAVSGCGEIRKRLCVFRVLANVHAESLKTIVLPNVCLAGCRVRRNSNGLRRTQRFAHRNGLVLDHVMDAVMKICDGKTFARLEKAMAESIPKSNFRNGDLSIGAFGSGSKLTVPSPAVCTFIT